MASFPPKEPPATGAEFPDPRSAGDYEVMAITSHLRPGTILSAYRKGIFPWPHERRGKMVVAWWSPDPRAIFPLEEPPRWSRSLRRSLRQEKLSITVDRAFTEVMLACGTERDSGTWITPEMMAGYVALHELGWAHSLEVWEGEALIGGIYGVAVGGIFAGESMFHRRTDASKIAFASLVEKLRAWGFGLFDVQVMTDHLASLGCIEISREEYLDRLQANVGRPASRI